MVFVNTLTADCKYPLQYSENFQLPIQMQLSEKRKKVFFEFFVPFMESTSNFKHFEKTMMILANVFRKLQAVKNFVTPLRKNRRFGTRLESRHGKVSRYIRNLYENAFIMFFHQFDSS